MAAHSTAHSSQAAGSSAAGACILDLPQEVLVRCLGLLELKPRLRSAALVCKLFAAAACSPELLREVDVGDVSSLQAVQSLTAWLARHGRHVRRLTTNFWEDAAEDEEATAAVAACLETANAAGQLVELCETSKLADTEWLAAMSSLRRLQLTAPVWSAFEMLFISPAISGLTALESLHLEGGMFVFLPGARLPPCITQLKLSEQGNESGEEIHVCVGVLAEVTRLPQLARLELSGSHLHCPNALSVLSRLSAASLTRLDVSESAVPPTLAALTRLQHFGLWLGGVHNYGHQDMITAALPQLTQLTSLVLDVPRLPAAVASLPRLPRCYGWSEQAVPLPAGPWLRSLRGLDTFLGMLVNNFTVLQDAPALQFLNVCGVDDELDWGSPAAAALLDWLAQHPPLRRICFDSYCWQDAADPSAFEASIAQLCRRRPGLQVQCYDQAKLGEQMFLQLLAEDCP